MQNIFQERLIAARKARGLSQAKLALEIQYTQMGVWEWEKGIKKPGLDYIIMLCQVLKVDPNYLLGY